MLAGALASARLQVVRPRRPILGGLHELAYTCKAVALEEERGVKGSLAMTARFELLDDGLILALLDLRLLFLFCKASRDANVGAEASSAAALQLAKTDRFGVKTREGMLSKYNGNSGMPTNFSVSNRPEWRSNYSNQSVADRVGNKEKSIRKQLPLHKQKIAK